MPETRPAATRRAPMRMLLAATASIALLAAACGSGEDTLEAASDDDATTESSTGETPEDTTPADDAEDELPGSDDDAEEEALPVAGDSDYTPTRPMVDITGPTVHAIDEIVMSDDGLTLGVRYQGAAEPCSGAMASVVEDDSTITVTLESGLNPAAASMSCIAEVISYELAVELEAPVGDREIIGVDPDGGAADDDATSGGGAGDTDNDGGTGSDDDGNDSDGTSDGTDNDDDAMEDGLSAPESFVGLSLDEAGAKADAEGRAWRISRQDDEQFGLTADYNGDRVTFEVDAGIVTAVVAG